jgi:hypothetical protein
MHGVLGMYYGLIDSDGIMPNIQGDSMVDESVTDSGAAVLHSVKVAEWSAAGRRLDRAGRRERLGVGPGGQA